MTVQRLLAIIIALQILVPSQVWAQVASTANVPVVHHHIHTPVNLNLSSTAASLHAGHLAANGATLNVGGHTMQVTPSTLLTAAERVALFQVISTGHQSLLLGNLGNAVGGSFNIGPRMSQFVSSLVIPQGVTAIDHLSNSGTLTLSGNLTNAGTLYAVSTNSNITNAIINASNIYNQQGGLITTMLPAGLSGVSGNANNLSLTLNALNNIVNAGSIQSSGNLSLAAGGSLTNALPSGATGTSPVVQAAGSLNLISGNIVNSGLMTSLNNNINISSATAQNISVNNSNGVLQALNGAVNVRDASFTANNNLSMTGGNILSQELNIWSGSGVVDVNVGNVTGVVNVTAGSGAISAETPSLVLGSMNFTGDPVFSNTGNFVISQAEHFSGEDLAIVAGGNITTAAGATIIDTSTTADNTNGGSITLVAGAAFTPALNNSDPLTITGASATGGKIDLFTGTAITSISSSATGANSNAGNIQLIAFKGTGTGSGSITLPSTTPINANSTHGNAGNITLIAGGANTVSFSSTSSVPVAISGGTTGSGTSTVINSIGSISASGASGTGNINISAATPTVSTGGVTITGGTITSGSFGSGASQNGQLYLGAVTSSGNLSVSAGNAITFNGAVNVGGTANVITTANNGNINVNNNFVAGGAVTMNANGTGSIQTPQQLIANPGVGAFAFGAALTPNGQFAYVPNNTDNTVSIIQTSTNTVVGTINLATAGIGITSPKGAVVSPDGSVVYVVGAATTGIGKGVVAVISTSSTSNPTITSYTVTATDSQHLANFDPQLVAVAPNGNVIVLSDYAAGTSGAAPSNNQLTIINPANPTNQVNITLTGVGKATDLGGLAVNPLGTLAYTANVGSNNISVVNLLTNTVSSTISLPSSSPTSNTFGPVALAFNPTGTRLYVGQSDANFNNSVGRVLMIDTTPTSASFNQVISVTGEITGGFLPQGMTLSPTGTQLYVNPTYYELSVVYNPLVLSIIQTPGIGTSTAPDGYGSNTFSGIVVNNGVQNVQTYIAAPTHTGGDGSVAVFRTPTIQGHNVSLQSGTGSIMVNYDAQGGTFTANTGGSVVAGNVGTATSTIGPSSASSSGGVFEVGSVNGLKTSGAISGSLISLTANSGGIVVGGNIGTTTSSVTLEVGGTGTITATGGTVTGSNVTLNTSGGNVGSSSQVVQLQSSNITVNSTGQIFIGETGTLTNLRATGGSSFLLSQNGALTISPTWQVIAPVLTYMTTNNGAISVNASLGSSEDAGTSISLIAGGSGAISQSGTTQLKANTISLQSGSGSIGSSTSAPIKTTTNNLTASSTGAVYVNNTGAISLVGMSGGSTFNLTSSGSITLSSGAVISASTGVNLTATTASAGITQVGATGTNTIFAPSIALSATGTIGSTGNNLSVAANTLTTQTVNLTLGGSGVFVAASNPGSTVGVNFTSSSSSTSTFQVTATGGINIASGAKVTATNSVSLTGASISQTSAGLTIISPTITLLASTGAIGLPGASIGINSGLNNVAALFNGGAATNIYLAGLTNGTFAGSVELNTVTPIAGVFSVSTQGTLQFNTTSVISAGSVALTSTGSISQLGTATTIFAADPGMITLSATGTGASIGASGAPIIIAGTLQNVTPQTVRLNANATSGNVYVSAQDTNTTNVVSVNLSGSSSGGTGATTFSVTATGGIQLLSGAKVTDSAGAISLTAGFGSSITQATTATTPSLTAVVVNLTADLAGASGTIGSSSTPLATAASTISASAGNNIFLSDSVATRATVVSTSGSVQLSDTSTVMFSGASSAATTFTVSAMGLSQAVMGATSITAPTVALMAGSMGIGSSGNPLGISDAGTTTSGVSLTLTSGGAAYIASTGIATSDSGYSLGASSVSSTLNINTSGFIASASVGFGSTAITKAASFVLNAGGNINVSVQNPTVSSALSLTANSGGDVIVVSASPVNLAGSSSAGGNASTGFSVDTTSGNIVFNTGAFITSTASTTGGAAVFLTANNGSITQMGMATPISQAVSIFSPTVTLTATTSATSTVGSSNTSPLILSSGISGTPLTLTASSVANTYISVPNVTGGATGNVILTGNNGVSGTAATSQFYLNAGGSISQSAATGTTSVFAHNVTLNSGAGIGSSNNLLTYAGALSGTGAQSVNLNFSANGNVFLNSLNSVLTSTPVSTVLTGTSKVLGPNNSLSLTSSGSLSASAAGLSLVAPTITLTAAGNIGTSTNTPLGINSGNGSDPVTVTVNSTTGNVFLSGATNGAVPGTLSFSGANSSAGAFFVTAAGSISIAAGATITSGANSTLTLNAMGTGSSISQADMATTTLFAPIVVLNSGTGTTASIGSSTNPIGIAQTSNDQSVQTVALTANAGSSVYLSALNSGHNTNAVSVNFAGASSAGAGNTNFSVNASGGIVIFNTAGGKITDSTGTITLTAGTGASITQAATSTTPILTAATVNLTADSSGTNGVIDTAGATPSALNVSTSNLSATAGSNVLLSNNVALLTFSATSNSGNVSLNDTMGVSFSGLSSAAGSYTLSANGQVTFQSGGRVQAPSIVMNSGSGGGFVQIGSSGNALTSANITLSAGSLGIGNSTFALRMASQFNNNIVTLSVPQSGGAVFIRAAAPSGNVDPAGVQVSANTSGAFNLNVDGDILTNGGTIKSSSAINLQTNVGGSSAGNIIVSVANAGSASTAVGLTALAFGNATLTAAGPVNLIGQSGAETNATTGFSLTAAGNINFNTGATVSTGAVQSVTLQASNKGSITQSTSGTAIFSPTINLLSDTTSNTTTIGIAGTPLGISSGQGSTAVLLNAKSGGGTFLTANVTPLTTGSGSVTLTGVNSLSSTSTTAQFVLMAAGNIALAAGAQVAAPGTISLTSTANGGTITQNDPTNTTTLFAPNIVLAATTGAGAIGSSTDALTVAASNTSAATQTVNLTLKAGDSVYVSTGNSVTSAPAVNANLTGMSTVANTFSLQSNGGISLASAAQVKATTANTGSITFNALSNISQASAGLTLIAPNLSLTSSGNVGMSTSSAIGINSGSSSGALLTVSAGGNAFVAGTTNGTTAGNVTLNNASQAVGTFNLTAAGTLSIASGATITANTSQNSSIVLTATGTSGSISQEDANGTTTIFAPNVTLTSGTGNLGIGSSAKPIGIAQTATDISPNTQSVALTVNAGGSAFIDAQNTVHTSNLVNVNMAGSSSAGFNGATFSVTASGNISLTNTTSVVNKITATTGAINLTAGTGGSITSNGIALNAPKVNLTADLSGTAGTITAGLASGTTVTVNGGATATLTGAGPLTLSNSANATSISVQTSGTINTTGTLSSPTITLESTASGIITLGGALTASTALNLETNGAVAQGSGGLATAGQISFTSPTGTNTTGAFGSTTASIQTATSQLTLSTTGAVYDSNSNASGTLTLPNAYTGTAFNVSTSGNLQVSSAITASTVNLAATSANSTLTLGANVGATGASVTLRGDNGISQSATTNRINGTNVTLQTATGGAGVSATPLQTNATNLFFLGTNSASSFVVNNQGAVSIGTPTGVTNNIGTLTLTAGGNITVSTTLPAANSTLTATGTNNSISAMAVLGSSSVSSSITLNPTGSGSVSTSGTGKFMAATLTLNGVTGNLGSATAPIVTQAATINASTGGAGTTAGTIGISNTGPATITLNTGGTSSMSGGTVSVVSTGPVTVAGTNSVAAKNGQFSITTSGANAGISFNSDGQINTLGSVSLTTTGATSPITQSGTAVVINTPQTTLKTAGTTVVSGMIVGSDIGTSSQSLEISGPLPGSSAESLGLTANSTGNTWLDASNSSGTMQVNMIGASSAAGANGFVLSNTSSTTGGGINLSSTGTITASNASLTGTVSLTSTGNITQSSPSAATLIAPNVALSGANIGNPALPSGNTIVFGNLPGKTTPVNLTVNTLNTTSGIALLSTPGAVQLASGTSFVGQLSLTSTGNVSLGTGAVLYGGTSLQISTFGSIISVPSSGESINTPLLSLTATGSIGTLNNQIGIVGVSAPISVTAKAGGNVYITDPDSGTGGAVIVSGSSSAGGTSGFNLTSAGNMSLSASITGTTSISLTVTGSANTLSQSGTTATLLSPNVSLTSAGDIGSSTQSIVSTASKVVIATTGTGNAFINDTNSTGSTITQSSTGGALTFNSTGPLTVSGSVTSNANTSSNLGNITLTAASGALNVNGNITANGGSIQIQDSNTTNGTISIGSGVSISTNVTATTKGTNGQVAIFIGPSTSTQNAITSTTTIGNVTYNITGANGVVYQGQTPSAILAPSGPVTINGTNQAVFFNSPSAARTITLGRNTTITADPQPIAAPGQQTLVAPAPANLGQPTVTPTTGSNSQVVLPATSLNISGSNVQIIQTRVTTDTLPKNVISLPPNLQIQAAPAETFEGLDISSSEIMLFDGTGLRSAQTGARTTARFSSQSDLQPVSSFSGVSQSALRAVENTVGSNPAANPFCLRQGSVLFAPSHNLTVKTPQCQVNVGAHSVVLVVATTSGVSVYNLHDGHIGDVSISSKDHKYPVTIGQHIMLSRSNSAFERLNPIGCISHSDMQAIDLPGGLKLFRSNFSMASAVSGLEPVLALKNSQNPQDRKLAARLIKDAAIMSLTSSSGKIFKRYAPMPNISQLP